MLGACLCTLERGVPVELSRQNQNLPILFALGNDFGRRAHSPILSPYARYSYNGDSGLPSKFLLPPNEFALEKVGLAETIPGGYRDGHFPKLRHPCACLGPWMSPYPPV